MLHNLSFHPFTRAVAFGVAASAAMTGCADEMHHPTDPSSSSATVLQNTSHPVRLLDDEFAELAKRLPGFGGLYVSDGQIAIFLTHVGDSVIARQFIRPFVDSVAGRAITAALAPSFRVLQGDYDFRDLLRWKRLIVSNVETHGLVSIDVDESRNRVRIGVLDSATRERVLQRLSALNVPGAATEIVLDAPANVETTVQQYQRPMVGGIQIQAAGSLPCTFTANVWLRPTYFTVDSTHNYFITSSHCTSVFGVVTGQQVGQPTMATEVIGWEQWDPPLFNSAHPYYGGLCPAGKLCRTSDAAMFYMQDVAGSWDYWPNTIASTSGLTIQYFVEISGTTANPLVGMTVYKVGRSTGETWGSVTASCVDVPQFDEGVDTGRWMICQGRANFSSQSGDSGAPVVSPPTGNYPVHIVGVFWGAGYFSRWAQVESELSQAAGVSGLRVSSNW